MRGVFDSFSCPSDGVPFRHEEVLQCRPLDDGCRGPRHAGGDLVQTGDVHGCYGLDGRRLRAMMGGAVLRGLGYCWVRRPLKTVKCLLEKKVAAVGTPVGVDLDLDCRA